MNGQFWTEKEDRILILLRGDGFRLREISDGLFHRSKRSVSNRLRIIQRTYPVR